MKYHLPATLAEALAIRAGEDVAVVAGGTDVYPAAVGRRAWGDPTHKDILDISALPGLAAMEETATAFRFGALTTWTDLIRTDLPDQFAGYQLAAREVGGVQVQNRGTLVGNIVTASPAGDGAPNLLVLEAEVEIASRRGVRVLPIDQFIVGYRKTALQPDEIVTALTIPRRPGARSHFVKLGARRYLVISIAMVATLVVLDGSGRVARARIAVGACSAAAQRLEALETALVGLAGDEALAVARGFDIGAALSPIDDVRASAQYRRAAAGTLVADSLASLLAPQTWRAA